MAGGYIGVGGRVLTFMMTLMNTRFFSTSSSIQSTQLMRPWGQRGRGGVRGGGGQGRGTGGGPWTELAAGARGRTVHAAPTTGTQAQAREQRSKVQA